MWTSSILVTRSSRATAADVLPCKGTAHPCFVQALARAIATAGTSKVILRSNSALAIIDLRRQAATECLAEVAVRFRDCGACALACGTRRWTNCTWPTWTAHSERCLLCLERVPSRREADESTPGTLEQWIVPRCGRQELRLLRGKKLWDGSVTCAIGRNLWQSDSRLWSATPS